MSSGGSFSDYRSAYDKSFSAKPEERRERLHSARGKVDEAMRQPKAGRDTGSLYDETHVRLGITKPDPAANAVWLVDIDNSGSNAAIAKGLRDRSGFLAAQLDAVAPKSQFAIRFVSDHRDDTRYLQSVDFMYPGEKADKVWFSSFTHVHGANGDDTPEAFECSLAEACETDLGDNAAKHLVLVTDSVAHGMTKGLYADDGCPHQRDWRASLRQVEKTFTSFTLIACGADATLANLQRQFIAPERLPFDFIDLSCIKNTRERLGMTANALTFVVARRQGLQMLEMYFAALYEKWLSEPLYGSDTDRHAREAIRYLGQYIEASPDRVEGLLRRVLGEE